MLTSGQIKTDFSQITAMAEALHAMLGPDAPHAVIFAANLLLLELGREVARLQCELIWGAAPQSSEDSQG